MSKHAATPTHYVSTLATHPPFLTVADGGTLNIGSQKAFLGNDNALLTTDPGGVITLSSGGSIDVTAGELSFNLDAGLTNYALVSGATISSRAMAVGVKRSLVLVEELLLGPQRLQNQKATAVSAVQPARESGGARL